MKKQPCILLGVTGSIAAYKAAALVRLLKKAGMDVHVVMTKSATKFVSELTFRTLSQNQVGVDMFAELNEWQPEHISLAEKADIFLVAPCSANVLAKVAHGIADDLLTCTALASTAPLVVAPAMNDKMWDNPATVANMATLKSRGVHIITVGSGDLACGYQGNGRMATMDEIMTIVNNLIKESE